LKQEDFLIPNFAHNSHKKHTRQFLPQAAACSSSNP